MQHPKVTGLAILMPTKRPRRSRRIRCLLPDCNHAGRESTASPDTPRHRWHPARMPSL